MNVKIKIPRYLQNKTNNEIITEVDGNTVYECIKGLIAQYPELDGELLDNRGMLLLKWMVYVNEKTVASSDGMTIPVKDGDVIEFLPLIDGG